MPVWEDDLGVTVSDANYKQALPPYAEQASTTSINVLVYTIGMPAAFNSAIPAPTSFKFIYQKMLSRGNSGGSTATTVTSSTNTKTITGLEAGALYKITTQAIGPSSEGNKLTIYFRLKGQDAYPTIIKSAADAQSKENKTGGLSYLTLKGGKSVDKKYTYCYKDFSAITVFEATQVDLGTQAKTGNRQYAPSYPDKVYYYAFGTSFLFPPLKIYEPQEGGIGFFLSANGESGYYVSFSTSGTASAKSHNPVRVMKVSGKQVTVLQDSQRGRTATLDELFSGSQQNIDIQVKVAEQKINIIVYINGFKIEAEDSNDSTKPYGAILPITQKVGLLAASGEVSFDYVYASNLRVEQYNKTSPINFYNQRFSNDFLVTQYGDIFYEDNSEADDLVTPKGTYFDEFGTVAREIVKREANFGSGASLPNSWTLGGNTNATILSQRKSHFKGEAFVLNNTSTNVPLADAELNSFAVFGSTIGFSGEIEYNTDPISEYAVREPITFESTWLQNQDSVEKLAEWIKGNIVNKAKVVEIKVFGNPLISVGDIINVNYPYQEFNGNEKIIITHVNHTFNVGLETSIKGRTI
jgi:hypothetical protein